MNATDIAFPHLGILLENVPKSFSIFGFTIAFYGLIIGIGVICGVLIASHVAKRDGLDPDVIWDFAIYAVVLSVMGARVYYVIFSWDLYKDDLLSILNLRQGGLAIYGGVITAFIVLFAYSHIKKINPFKLGDCGVHGLILGQIVGRWGNFFNREAFGEYTDSLFAMRLPVEAVRAKDITDMQRAAMEAAGVNYIQVHPTFLYESVLNLILLILMLIFGKKKKYDGQLCLVYLGGYGIIRFFVEGLRTDQLLIPGTSIAVSQMLGLVLFIFAIIMNFVVLNRKKKENS